MQNKLMAFLLATAFLLPLTLTAKEKRGADLIVEILNGNKISGELITVKDHSLLISKYGVDVSVDIAEISVITIVKKSRALTNAGVGFLAGAGLGALIGLRAYDAEKAKGGWMLFDQEYYALGGGAVGGAAGALAGVIASAVAAKDKTIQFEGKSEAWIKHELSDLREIARVKEY
jgi:hypothetical protein